MANIKDIAATLAILGSGVLVMSGCGKDKPATEVPAGDGAGAEEKSCGGAGEEKSCGEGEEKSCGEGEAAAEGGEAAPEGEGEAAEKSCGG